MYRNCHRGFNSQQRPHRRIRETTGKIDHVFRQLIVCLGRNGYVRTICLNSDPFTVTDAETIQLGRMEFGDWLCHQAAKVATIASRNARYKQMVLRYQEQLCRHHSPTAVPAALANRSWARCG